VTEPPDEPPIEPEIVTDTELAVPTASRSKIVDAQRVIALFLSSKSELTAKNYGHDLNRFAEFLRMPDPATAIAGLLTLNSGEAHAVGLTYVSTMKRDGYSPSTINRRLAAIRSLLSTARILGLCTFSLEVPNVRRALSRKTEGCGDEAYARLVDVLLDDIEEADEAEDPEADLLRRDLAMVLLLGDGGLRRKELLTILVPDDMDLAQARVRMLGKDRLEKEWVPVADDVCDAITDWVALRGEALGPLFPSLRNPGQTLSVKTINRRVTRAADRANVNVTPHGLRHTGTTMGLNAGLSVREVAAFLRHVDTKLVSTYDDDRKRLAGAVPRAIQSRRRQLQRARSSEEE
jgi:integrase/recombinase XerC